MALTLSIQCPRVRLVAGLVFLLGTTCGWGAPRNGTVSGALVVEPPTLISLGFEWRIEGDDNRNASVGVSYRKKGETFWKAGLPLFRLQAEKVINNVFSYTGPNMFAGSIFDLQPDTEYECRFTLSDPDGVGGRKVQTAVVRTRPEPKAAEGGHTYHVYPRNYEGTMQQPGFKGLKEAYFTGSIGGDWYNSYPPRVRPGDIILVHAGIYKDNRYRYGHELLSHYKECCDNTWDGTYYLTGNGTADRPIVIKAAGDGEVIFDGDGNHTLFNLMGGNYNYFEGITFRNTEVAIEAGLKDIAGSSGLTVKRCLFDHVGVGVHTDWSGSKNYYIADNVFIGKHDPDLLLTWNGEPPVGMDRDVWLEKSQTLSQFAVKVYGSGHVVAFNRVRNFHDGIDHATYGLPDGYPSVSRDRLPASNDFYNNDISNVHDDCIEADGSAFNMRVFRNLCVNAKGSAVSMQPIYGGPVYFIRNVAYHVPGTFAAAKFSGPAGAVFYHNTFTAAIRAGVESNVHFRNNLILAEVPSDPALAVNSYTNYTSSDYNGFMAGAKAPAAFVWQSPAFSKQSDYTPANLEKRQYKTLSEFSQATGQDKHSVMVTHDIFEQLRPADPAAETKVYDPETIDFRLKPGSPAEDAGVILPNVNDGFKGRAPDLGAYEIGVPPPHYGPR
jgi:hypothetical protein